MGTMSLPPGFRFHPTDVELVMYYLKRKVLGKKFRCDAIADVNIYKFSPWDLPDKSCLRSKDLEWFFFCPREKKYASGVRVRRDTEKGYWKTTGKDRDITNDNRIIGTVKTLVFHIGRAPRGERTDWVIHEYRILDDQLAAAGAQDTYVLCKVFKKSGPGPKNGAQYGAPFNESDWTDDDIDDAQNHDISLTPNDPSPTWITMPEDQSCPVPGLFDPGSTSGLPSVEEVTSTSVSRATSDVLADDADELDWLLASFTHESTMPSKENEITQEDPSGKGKHKSTPCPDGYEIYDSLGDLDGWFQMNNGRLDSLGFQNDYSLNEMLSQDNSAFIELNDLQTPLACPAGVTVTDQSSVDPIFGQIIDENMEQFYPDGSFIGMDQYAPCATQLPLLPEGDNRLEVLEMGNNQLYCGSTAAYHLDFASSQPESGVKFTEHMERGAPKKICMSRLIPARPPSAAACSLCCGGSSIHIKAEVTHGAGECTNEALLLMMGGSGSCWATCLVQFFKNFAI